MLQEASEQEESFGWLFGDGHSLGHAIYDARNFEVVELGYLLPLILSIFDKSKESSTVSRTCSNQGFLSLTHDIFVHLLSSHIMRELTFGEELASCAIFPDRKETRISDCFRGREELALLLYKSAIMVHLR